MPAIAAECQNFGWKDAEATCAHRYLLPALLGELRRLAGSSAMRILDLGCGNGYVAARIAALGHHVIGVDVSQDGIGYARAAYPGVRFEVASVYEDRLAGLIGAPVDCVIALEVTEHLFYPKKLFEMSYSVLRNGGSLIVSTPYHGYLKNLAISLVNGWDRHFEVERDGGHIKFFSPTTLCRMAQGAGFRRWRFRGVGRFPWLWKSMIAVFQE